MVNTTTGAYVAIHNNGEVPDKLVSARCACAATATLHTMKMKGGVMEMAEQKDGFVVAPGQSVIFAPGGNHIMLTRLNRTLRAGDAVELTLDFERSPDQTIAVRILPATATDSHGMAM